MFVRSFANYGNPQTELKVKMLESNGYKTPKVDVRAVVFNDRNEILMVKEKIDDCWSLPGGWADIGYSPSEVAEKETREEAGADVLLSDGLEPTTWKPPIMGFLVSKTFLRYPRQEIPSVRFKNSLNTVTATCTNPSLIEK